MYAELKSSDTFLYERWFYPDSYCDLAIFAVNGFLQIDYKLNKISIYHLN
jgi:hypothetical protein